MRISNKKKIRSDGTVPSDRIFFCFQILLLSQHHGRLNRPFGLVQIERAAVGHGHAQLVERAVLERLGRLTVLVRDRPQLGRDRLMDEILARLPRPDKYMDVKVGGACPFAYQDGVFAAKVMLRG